MLDANATLDSLEALVRDPDNRMVTRTLVSGIVRIDAHLVRGVMHWRVNGRTASRETAVSALVDARAARLDK
jgi:hypothetical protein